MRVIIIMNMATQVDMREGEVFDSFLLGSLNRKHFTFLSRLSRAEESETAQEGAHFFSLFFFFLPLHFKDTLHYASALHVLSGLHLTLILSKLPTVKY